MAIYTCQYILLYHTLLLYGKQTWVQASSPAPLCFQMFLHSPCERVRTRALIPVCPLYATVFHHYESGQRGSEPASYPTLTTLIVCTSKSVYSSRFMFDCIHLFVLPSSCWVGHGAASRVKVETLSRRFDSEPFQLVKSCSGLHFACFTPFFVLLKMKKFHDRRCFVTDKRYCSQTRSSFPRNSQHSERANTFSAIYSFWIKKRSTLATFVLLVGLWKK